MSVLPYAQDLGHLAGHLTQLYSETKKTALSNVPKDIKDDSTPALSSLHRKFRIQKDRLITWGLEWSDEGKGPDGNIDGSVARAGLTETVTSVLENIKEVLEQAERIRSASLPVRTQTWSAPVPEKSIWLSVDLSRYRDLVTDLTTSIDILYDLSRNRRALVAGSHPSLGSDVYRFPQDEKASLKSSLAAEASVSYAPDAFASRRFGLPAAINESALILPDEGPPPYQNAGVPLTTRMIGRLLLSQAPEEVRLFLQESLDDPLVLIEYANFDTTVRGRNTPPPVRTMETISDYLQQAKIRPQLNLLGYFEDTQTSRLGLVYDLADCLPEHALSGEHGEVPIEASSLLNTLQTASKTAKAYETMTATPPLEERFRLALRIAEHLQCMHSSSFIHGGFTSDSIVFIAGGDNKSNPAQKISTPVIGSFDVFYGSPAEMAGAGGSPNNIYQHPDNRGSEDSPAARLRYDVYSLGLALLEIGLWTPLSDLHKSKYQLKDFKLRLEKIWIPRLSVKCGSLYMAAVQSCFNFSDSTGNTTLASGHYDALISRLRRCCLLCDEGRSQSPSSLQKLGTQTSNLPSRARRASPPLASRVPTLTSESSVNTLGTMVGGGTPKAEVSRRLSPISGQTLSFRETRDRVVLLQRLWRQRQMSQMGGHFSAHDSPARRSSGPKQKAFPVRLSPQHLAEWHSDIGLRISHVVERALKNSLESSTIDLVSLGHDEASARPTILVTCTSTAKVKAAIKHCFQCDTGIFDVKVRKGTVGLSRRSGRGQRDGSRNEGRRPQATAGERVKRSQAHTDSESGDLAPEPRNPFYHPRPICGSSIGAYNSDEGHLMPVSFGGVVLVDNEPYGMSVHHMLEPESDEESDDAGYSEEDDDEDDVDVASDDASSRFESDGDDNDDEDDAPPLIAASPSNKRQGQAVTRSKAKRHKKPTPARHEKEDTSDDSSSSDIDFDSATSSAYSSEFESDSESQPEENLPLPAGPVASEGDTRGFFPSATLTSAWRITQPALLDAQKTGWHPLDQDQLDTDADHLASFELGALHASSGLRRHRDAHGLLHEIDWALFSIKPSRLQPANLILGGRTFCHPQSTEYKPGVLESPVLRNPGDSLLGEPVDGGAMRYPPEKDVYPALLAPEAEYPSLPVLAMGRTSGLTSSTVSPAQSFVKLYGRRSFSSSWTVVGGTDDEEEEDEEGAKFGIAGDSGTWIVDNMARVVGVVLAHQRAVTYFCPMAVVMADVARACSMGANEAVVELPGQRECEASPPVGSGDGSGNTMKGMGTDVPRSRAGKERAGKKIVGRV